MEDLKRLESVVGEVGDQVIFELGKPGVAGKMLEFWAYTNMAVGLASCPEHALAVTILPALGSAVIGFHEVKNH